MQRPHRGFSFIQVCFIRRERFFVLAFPDLRDRWDEWKQRGRQATERFLDYLGGLREVLTRGESRQRKQAE